METEILARIQFAFTIAYSTPYLLYATNNAQNSITITNAASYLKIMKTLLLIAAIGTALAGLYTAFVFWTFKGKVTLNEMSY